MLHRTWRTDTSPIQPSTSGNLAKALKLSQSICDRIEVQRQKYKSESETPAELEIPFMFAFRVLYNISVIYLLVGSLPVRLYCELIRHCLTPQM